MRLKPIPLLAILCLPFILSFDSSGDETIVFTAYVATEKINIHWTASLYEQSTYHLLRSRDGQEFEEFRSVVQADSISNVDFLESDFNPFLGWSYYRIKKVDKIGIETNSPIAPVFFHGNMMSKGEVLVANKPGSDASELERASLNKLNGMQAVLVLRSKSGDEYYCESALIVKKNSLYISKSETISEGVYHITASSKNEIVGLEVTVE